MKIITTKYLTVDHVYILHEDVEYMLCTPEYKASVDELYNALHMLKNKEGK